MEGKGVTILVVDDQSGVRHLLTLLGREEGHLVHCAVNGLEAVEIAKAVRPDLVFLDVRMPVMDGLEALPLIRGISPAPVVVMMTAYGNDAAVHNALDQGAAAVLTKPFDLEQVRDLMHRIALTRSGRAVAGERVG